MLGADLCDRGTKEIVDTAIRSPKSLDDFSRKALPFSSYQRSQLARGQDFQESDVAVFGQPIYVEVIANPRANVICLKVLARFEIEIRVFYQAAVDA